MKRTLPWIATVALLMLTACGGSESSEVQASASDSVTRASSSGAPKVEAAHQKAIDAAWAKAAAGENPTHDCARIKGTVVGTKTVDSSGKTLHACNVDLPARYFLARLDRVERGDATCQAFMMEVFTQLPAMTMNTAGLERAVAQGGASDADAPGVAGGIIGEVVKDGTTDLGAGDPKRLIKDQIASRTTQVCPDVAPTVLQ
jgi:hypothetical protein